MVKHRNLLAVLFLCLLLSLWLRGLAAVSNPEAEELFAMAERLEKCAPWAIRDIGKIEKITGRGLQEHGYTDFYSDKTPDDRLLRQMEVVTAPGAGRVTCVSLDLPRKGLGISRTEVFSRYGQWTNSRENWGEMKTEGFHTSVEYGYKHSNGSLPCPCQSLSQRSGRCGLPYRLGSNFCRGCSANLRNRLT